MKPRTIFSGIGVTVSVAGLLAVTWLEHGLHPAFTGIGAAAFVVGIIGGFMVMFADERNADQRG
ncbi:hypothetical protein EV667_3678 [Ancylobacter aquaticus]|uniref:Uncharacterized protein n=1 Tax=Ancylobacter aquaticus TaxID=100 RepID=A0A4R1HSK6_ANCAQ|nr:hypothetical protein [Ancylobacter aquaticus]TCK23835.1 hypothetical protein EV667_3678 [Ancylobacter aquaticus]